MDTLTHALSGALLARATAPRDAPPRSTPRRVAAGFFAAAAPDLDFVIGFLGPVQYLLHHRGATHSLLLLPLWAFPVAWLLAKILREPDRDGTAGWRALYGVCALSIGLHIAGDWITGFGTMLLAPVSDWRAALGTTFIIDLWFSGIILTGLLVSLFFFRSRIPSRVALAVLVGYVGFQYQQKEKALEFGAQYAQRRGMAEAEVAAHPRPVSPYNWTVFVSDAREHHFAHVNLVRAAPRVPRAGEGFVARLDAPYLPLAAARWEVRNRFGDDALAQQAWDSPALGFFRWFAAHPAYDGASTGSACVWFVDLRFVNPGRDWVPFRFGACRDAPGAPWRAYERLESGARQRLD